MLRDPRRFLRHLLLAGSLLLPACSGLRAPAGDEASPGGVAVPATADPFANRFQVARRDPALPVGVYVRLSDIAAMAAVERAPGPAARPLAADRAEALLLRLAGPAPDAPNLPEFRFASRSLPAPRPGTTTRGLFLGQAGQAPAVAARGPVRALSFAPRGVVATTSQVSVTFSHPMVPLSALVDPPPGTRLSPAPAGSWRWLDPFTLVFDAVGGLPKATRYTAEIPAGLVSAEGQVLREGVRWTFATAPAAVREVVATDAPDLARPVIVIVFDQPVDPAAVLRFLRLQVDGGEFSLRLATAGERALPRVRSRLAGQAPDRVVAVRPEQPLPTAGDSAGVEAVLRALPGLPSLEGPERTATESTHAFRIRRALRVVEHGCGRADVCRPGLPWTVRFNHALRPPPDSGSWVRIEPALPGATVEVWGNHIVVLGAAADTTYTVWLDRSIASSSGDTLGPVAPLRFAIGRPAPAVWAPGGGLALLRPGAPARYPILAEGTDSVRVMVRAVGPADWPRYYTLAGRYARKASALPGRELFQTVLPVTGVRGGPGEAIVDLEAALEEAGGHVLLLAEPATGTFAGERDAALIWIQRGGVALDVAEDAAALTVQATAAGDGRPLEGVLLDLLAERQTRGAAPRPIVRARTDASGLARLNADHAARGAWLLVATHRGRTSLFPARIPADDPHWRPWGWRPALRAHFITDRPIYAPGDTVRFAGWLRRAAGPGLEPKALAEDVTVAYTARGPRYEEIGEGTLAVRPNGRLEGSLALPPEVNAGRASMFLDVTAPTHLYTFLRFEIQEVRRPNFDVALSLDPGPHVSGARIEAEVRASYFTGGGLPGAELNWRVMSGLGWYSPPGRADYAFGLVRPLWAAPVEPATHTAKTDASGRHHLEIRIDSVRPAVPMVLHIQATATDLDQQSRSGTARVLVHPADVYVGLRTPARFVRAGERLTIEALVVGLDGEPVEGRPVQVRALRQDREVSSRTSVRPGPHAVPAPARPYEQGKPVVRERRRGSCALRSRAGPVRCRLDDLPAGDYVIVASVQDTLGRRSESELAVRIAAETIPAAARAMPHSVLVQPDRAEYQPGDTAEVLVQAPFPARQALLTIRRGGVLEARPLALEKGVGIVAVTIADAHVPNVHLHVAAIAADGARAEGSAEVRVVPASRRLAVAVEPRSAEMAPGGSTTVVVTVTDPAGRPVPGADMVLSAVDEALLALSRTPRGDPLSDIYPASGPGVIDRSLRAHLAPRAGPAGVPAPGRERPGRAGTVTGVVIDGITGRPVAHAWVELAGTAAGAWTRPDGTYEITGVPAGEHVLEARADGFVTAPLAGVAVRGGATARAHFLLLTRQAVLAGARSWLEQVAAGLWFGHGALAVEQLVVAASPVSLGLMQAVSPEGPFLLAGGAQQPAPLLRKDFSPVAAFVLRARTGADGRAEIPITLPHSLTRYRLRAVVAKGDRLFGAGEASVTARLPLMVRPVPPRFLNQGDRFELPVLVENRTGAPLEIDVAARAINAELAGPAGRRVVVPAQDRVELRFPAVAGVPGTARFQIVAAPADTPSRLSQTSAPPGRRALPERARPTPSSAIPPAGAIPATLGGGDAADVTVPVLVPVATEAFAVYGQLDDARPVAYPLRLPPASLPGQGRVELGFSTTAAHGLHDALFFLWRCSFDLPEVWASRVLALSALRDMPAAAPWPRAIIDSAIARDVTSLARLQLRDGGWSLWTARFDADPFVSVHASHALQRAKASGAPVPEHTLNSALSWLRRLDEHAPADTQAGPRGPPPFPVDFPLQARRAVQAYALDVRRRLGDDVSASAAALLRDAGAAALPAEALAWLLPALAADSAYAADAEEVRRALSGRIVRSAGTAGIVSRYDAGGRRVFYSPRRTDAVVLAALVEDGSAPELVASIARGLMAHRIRGRWANTQENAFAVAALAGYLSAAEVVEPSLVARAWAGPRLAGERAFRGRSDERHELAIPTDSLGSPGDEVNLVLAREGAGRLYYRLGLSYALAGPSPPLAHGFDVARSYEAVDDPADVRRDEDGNWRVRLGARVRVRITVAAAGPRYHVAVVDPLPAGFEAMNRALAGTSGLFAPPAYKSTHARAAVASRGPFPLEHVNVKADRFEAFTTLLQPGRRDITYLALATTPGTFAAPAPRAEEMYAPETFGRGAAERVIVAARETEAIGRTR